MIRTIETALEADLSEHLGDDEHHPLGRTREIRLRSG